MAVEAFAPTMVTFRRGRDFAAWLGLVPRQHSSGAKQVLGRTSKMGQRDIRRLLYYQRDDRHSMGMPESSTRELVAGMDAGAQTSYARCDRPRQQIGSIHLGNDNQERRLQRFRSCCSVACTGAEVRTDPRRVRRSANGKDEDR